MTTLLTWHQRVAKAALRLFLLHLLWLWWTLRGGIVLGVFPATAAVYAVVRRDVLDENGGGEDAEPARLVPLFGETWRREFAAANRLGVLLTAGWGLLVYDRHLVAVVDLGRISPVLAGLLSVLTAAGLVVTVLAWCLAAHFAEPVRRTMLRAVLLVLARPLHALTTAGATGVVLAAYYLVPGLVPVFGVAVPAFVSFRWLWYTGVLPAPSRTGPASSTPPSRAGRSLTGAGA